MYCKRCGHQVANGAMYCGRCGLNIANVQRQRAARRANARRNVPQNAPQPRATRFTQAAPLPQTIQAKPKTTADSRPAARNRTTPAAKKRKGALNAKVIAAALVAVMIAVIGFCTGTDGNLQSFTGRAIQPVKAFEKSDVPADQAKLYKWFPKGTKNFPMPYYRSQLNGGQQRAYDEIFEGLMSMEKEIGLDVQISCHDLSLIWEYILYDHPEMFWSFECPSLTSNSSNVTVSPNYIVSEKKRDNLRKKMEATADSIVGETANLPSQYEKAQYLYDQLAQMTTYDQKSFDNDMAKKERGAKSIMKTQTAKGPLVDHEAVCEGYSRAYQYLCYKAGIPCITVGGTVPSDAAGSHAEDKSASSSGADKISGHAWNACIIDGMACYMDVTWDDNERETNDHLYFCASRKTMEETGHHLDNPDITPKAKKDKLEWWKLHDTEAGSYNLDSAADLICRKLNEGETSLYLKFDSAKDVEAFCSDFHGEGNPGAQALCSRLSSSVSYSVCPYEEAGVVHFEWC